MSKALLPPNASPFEGAVADAIEAATAIDVSIRNLWRPDDCPPDFLPYLAWALSVDEWDAAWTDATKRAVIRASLDIHRRKGSPAAVRKALEAIGFNIDLTEWHEDGGAPNTFTLDAFAEDVFAAGFAIDTRLLQMVERLIEKTKPAREHFTLRIGETFQSDVYVRSGAKPRQVDRDIVDPSPRTSNAEEPLFIRSGVRAKTVSAASHDPSPRTRASAASLTARSCARSRQISAIIHNFERRAA